MRGNKRYRGNQTGRGCKESENKNKSRQREGETEKESEREKRETEKERNRQRDTDKNRISRTEKTNLRTYPYHILLSSRLDQLKPLGTPRYIIYYLSMKAVLNLPLPPQTFSSFSSPLTQLPLAIYDSPGIYIYIFSQFRYIFDELSFSLLLFLILSFCLILNIQLFIFFLYSFSYFLLCLSLLIIFSSFFSTFLLFFIFPPLCLSFSRFRSFSFIKLYFLLRFQTLSLLLLTSFSMSLILNIQFFLLFLFYSSLIPNI